MIKKAEILPREVEVCQWTGHNADEMIAFAGKAVHDIYEKGDYVVKANNEVIDVCSEDNFKERYRFIE